MDQFKSNDNKENPADQKNNSSVPATSKESVSSTSEKNNTISNRGENKGDYKQKISLPTWIMPISTVFIMFITLFYMIAAWKQAHQMEEAVNIASDTAVRQLRAYISIHDIGVTNVSPNNKPLITIKIKNTGQTPANEVRCWAKAVVREAPLKTSLPDKSPGSGTIAVMFHDKTYNNIFQMDDPLTAQQITSLSEGTVAIYIYGGVDYIDAFKNVRQTSFVAAYNSISGPVGINTGATALKEDAD
jgi:hypothetical protein